MSQISQQIKENKANIKGITANIKGNKANKQCVGGVTRIDRKLCIFTFPSFTWTI